MGNSAYKHKVENKTVIIKLLVRLGKLCFLTIIALLSDHRIHCLLHSLNVSIYKFQYEGHEIDSIFI